MNPKNIYAKTEQGIHLMKRIDNKLINRSRNEIRLFSCIRNEVLRLPYFLDYHRSMGVDRFIFIDNETVTFSGDVTVIR